MTDIAGQRRAALRARRGLSPRQRETASRSACRRLARLPVIRRARRVGLYWPLASEADPRGLIDRLPAGRRHFYPRVQGERLGFVAFDDAGAGARWRRSALGVFEPRGPARDASHLDVLIMPLAGFDAAAHRIGLGGGFYDRTLAGLRYRAARRPCCIGLAFEAQKLSAITPQPWDVPLDLVVTEAAIYRPAASGLVRHPDSL